MWLAVLVIIAAVFGYNFYVKNQAADSGEEQKDLQKTYGIEITSPESSDQNSLPQEQGIVLDDNYKLEPLPSLSESEGVKVYRSSEYEFEFTYPANFGEVTIKNYECAQGFLVVGSFEHSPNIDFGYVSSGYKNCENFGFQLFETVWFEKSGEKLKLITADQTAQPAEVAIEQTFEIPSGGFVPYMVYIFKNTVEAGGNGAPVAVSGTPNPDIGALTFRTHNLSYEEGVKLLEEIIK